MRGFYTLLRESFVEPAGKAFGSIARSDSQSDTPLPVYPFSNDALRNRGESRKRREIREEYRISLSNLKRYWLSVSFYSR
jgi:hypothetical protein